MVQPPAGAGREVQARTAMRPRHRIGRLQVGLVLLRAQQDIFRSGHSRAAGVSVPDIAVRGKTGRRGAVHAAVRADHKRFLRAQRIEMPPAAAGHRAKNQGCLCSQSRISFAAS